MLMDPIATRIKTVNQHLTQLTAHPVIIMAVSKYQSVSNIRTAYANGIRHFGETIWQDAREKIQSLQDLPIQWHFIGRLQSNKIKPIAQHFDWVHTLATCADVTRFAKAAQMRTTPLNICIQVGLKSEENRRCCPLDDSAKLLEQIQQHPTLHVKGLMSLPPAHLSTFELDHYYQTIQHEFEHQKRQHPIDTLCMGMSQDYPQAIEAGATMIRLGTIIFGAKLT